MEEAGLALAEQIEQSYYRIRDTLLDHFDMKTAMDLMKDKAYVLVSTQVRRHLVAKAPRPMIADGKFLGMPVVTVMGISGRGTLYYSVVVDFDA